MWVLLAATALASLAAERIGSGSWPLPPRRAVGLSAAFLVWCALTLAWDLNPGDGASKLAQMIAVFASALALLGVADRLDAAQRTRLARLLAGGVVVGLVLLGIETVFDYPLQRTLLGDANPRLAYLAESKRSVDALPVIIWCAALGLERLRRPWLGVALAVIFAVASLRLTTSSAIIGMGASLAVFAAASWSAPVTRRLVAAAIAAAFILIIPGALLAYSPTMTPATCGLKFSACHRIEIWHFAATKSLERPLFGHGLNSSRFVPNDGAVSAFQPLGSSVITLHPHDAFLQVWLELGAVGVILAGTLLLSLLGALRQWPGSPARFALAAYTGGIVVAALAFGIWQTWWMATLGFGIVACAALVGQEDRV
jgi:O-antigen ligase